MMNYHNMTHDELVQVAEVENNVLAIELINNFEEFESEKEESLNELIDEVVEYFVEKVEKQVEEYNEDYYLNPESDYNMDLADMISQELDRDSMNRLIEELSTDTHRSASIFSDDEKIIGYLESLDSNALDELACDIHFHEAYSPNINRNIYRSSAYSLACCVAGANEEEIEYLIEGIPTVLHEKVIEGLTGSKDSSHYVIDNYACTLELVMDLDWLENWVLEKLEESEVCSV